MLKYEIGCEFKRTNCNLITVNLLQLCIYIKITYIKLHYRKPQLKMYKLWRRQINKPSTSDFNSKKKQSQFIQSLSQTIKIVKKKQQFYVRISFLPLHLNTNPPTSTSQGIHFLNNEKFNLRQHTVYVGSSNTQTIAVCEDIKQNGQKRQHSAGKVTKLFDLQLQLQALVTEQQQILSNIKTYEQQSFFLSKTFLYTMFVRLLQIFDYCRQKIIVKIKNEQLIYCKNWQKYYQQNKLILTQCYQNLVYFQNYNVLELLNTALKKQNFRIFSIVPLRIKKNQISLKPLTRLNSAQLRKASSSEINIKKQQRIIEIINKKSSVKQKKMLETQKRIELRKKLNQKPITLKNLYGILNIKIPKIQQGYVFKRQMQIQALQRNQTIKQQRKKWQKKCQNKNYSIRFNQSQQKAGQIQ